MTTFVLLTDNDNCTLLVACEDVDEARKIGSAAVFSDGDTSAWLIPAHATADAAWVASRLRAGESAGDLAAGIDEMGFPVQRVTITTQGAQA